MAIPQSSTVKRAATCSMGRARGFTLIEVMVTLSILAVLTMVAAPSFNEAILSNRLSSFANNFIASSNLARGEATKRNATVTMCRSADGATCAGSGGWEQGWIVFHDVDADGVVDAGETIIQKQEAMTGGYQLTGDAYTIMFSSVAGGSTAANLMLCRLSPLGSQERVLKVKATGRASVSTERNGSCA